MDRKTKTAETRKTEPAAATVKKLEKRIEVLNAELTLKNRALKRWQTAFDASPDLISVMDVHHRILMVNKAMAEAMGCLPEEVRGQKCYQLLHHSDKPPMACPQQRLLENGLPNTAEIFERRLNRWFLVSVTPLYDKNQQIAGSIHIARDVTRLKKAEQALRESEGRYRQLAEATLEGVLLSEGTVILAANQVLADMVGYSLDELHGHNLLKFVAREDRTRVINRFRRFQAGVYELKCVRRDGTYLPIQASSRPVSYQGRMAIQTAIRDLTDQKNAERESAARERLQGVLEMAGAVSHELNQPLMALNGYSELLAANLAPDDPMRVQMAKIAEQLRRMGQISRKLMRITKYETRTYAGGEKIIDLDRAAQEDLQ